MAHDRRFRFGVQLARAGDADSWATMCRRAEELGYSSVLLPDHFDDQLAPIPALQAAADATSSLRVGALVFDNDYKHPVVLAKECATLDVLSGGRLELGIGAGWMRTDYERSGIPYDPPGVRVSRFEEGLAVLKGCLSGVPFSFDGEHYQVSDLTGAPVPVQQPHPPFIIGGGGRRMLGIAGRHADIVGVNPSLAAGEVGPDAAADATAAATDRKLGWLRSAAGDRFDDLEVNCLVLGVVPTDDTAGTAAEMAPLFGLDPADLLEVPHVLIGSHEQMIEQLEARRQRWAMSYVVVQGEDTMEAFAPVVAELAGR
ncbi:MAG: TIGR03621 family F420-dependent LLM class oxidoreductase [Acidimicrobiia bacterium]|nr:TIGR03621 family F420-dependent LLM class oxidoreductase [Acidimicrobiia bacterium]